MQCEVGRVGSILEEHCHAVDEAELETVYKISNAMARAEETVCGAEHAADKAVVVAGIKMSMATSYLEEVVHQAFAEVDAMHEVSYIDEEDDDSEKEVGGDEEDGNDEDGGYNEDDDGNDDK